MTISFKPSSIVDFFIPALQGQSYLVIGWLLMTAHSIRLYDTRESALSRSLSDASLGIEDEGLHGFLKSLNGIAFEHEGLLREVLIEGKLKAAETALLHECAYLRWQHQGHTEIYLCLDKQWQKSERDPYLRNGHWA